MRKVVITASNVSDVDKSTRFFLEQAGFEVEEYPDAFQYKTEDMIRILENADAVIVGLEKYTREIIDQLHSLKIIARRGVGVDNIDLVAANEHGITVTRTEGFVGSAVAELIMAYILESARLLSSHNSAMKQGIWSRRLAGGAKGKTLGLIGFGSISKETAIRANAFGMNVLCFYRHRNFSDEQTYQVEYTDFDTIVAESDYLAINVPLTDETKNMFHKAVFERMKPSSVLINTARGAVVNTADLVSALREGKIRSAYIDAFDYEPCTNSPLHSLENAILTPHIGTFTKENFTAMNNRCAEQIIQFFNPDTIN